MNMRLFWSVLCSLPATALGLGIVLGFVAPPALIFEMLLLIPAVLGWGLIYGQDARFEKNKVQLDMVIDLLRSYPDDWKVEEMYGDVAYSEDDCPKIKRGVMVATRYSLHDNVVIRRATEWGERDGYSPLVVAVTNPEETKQDEEVRDKVTYLNVEGQATRYKPNGGYCVKIDEALKVLQTYRAMKTFVAITVTAEEQRRAPDRAQKALDDFRERNGLGTSMADTGVSLDLEKKIA